jgi:hypothetical protein
LASPVSARAANANAHALGAADWAPPPQREAAASAAMCALACEPAEPGASAELGN